MPDMAPARITCQQEQLFQAGPATRCATTAWGAISPRPGRGHLPTFRHKHHASAATPLGPSQGLPPVGHRWPCRRGPRPTAARKQSNPNQTASAATTMASHQPAWPRQRRLRSLEECLAARPRDRGSRRTFSIRQWTPYRSSTVPAIQRRGSLPGEQQLRGSMAPCAMLQRAQARRQSCALPTAWRMTGRLSQPERIQLRPAITPPSTSQMAPVTQLASSLSRKLTTLATSSGAPILPIGWKPLNEASVSSSLPRSMKAS